MKGSFPALAPRPINQRVYDALRASIVGGALQPEERLVESAIARQMGISRAPVREAIRQLQQEGLVVAAPWRGTSVVGVTAETIPHLYQVRAALETLAVRLLIARGIAVAAELDAIVADIAAAATAGDLAAVVEHEVRFHEVLCERSGNPILARLFQAITAQVRMALTLDNGGYDDLHLVATEHLPLIAAIRDRDLPRALALLEAHILDSVAPLVRRLSADANAGDEP